MQNIKKLINVVNTGNAAERKAAFEELKDMAEKTPEILTSEIDFFFTLLHHKDNRKQWESMQILSSMAKNNQKKMFDNLAVFADVADKGSVITRDHYVKILSVLATNKYYSATVLPLMIDEVLKSPVNQLPNYAETVFSVIDEENKIYLKKAIEDRLEDVAELPAKEKRLQKILKKL